MLLVARRYNVEQNLDAGKPGVPEWPLIIQDIVVDTPVAGDPAGICRLKYDRLGEPALWSQYLLPPLNDFCMQTAAPLPQRGYELCKFANLSTSSSSF